MDFNNEEEEIVTFGESKTKSKPRTWLGEKDYYIQNADFQKFWDNLYHVEASSRNRIAEVPKRIGFKVKFKKLLESEEIIKKLENGVKILNVLDIVEKINQFS